MLPKALSSTLATACARTDGADAAGQVLAHGMAAGGLMDSADISWNGEGALSMSQCNIAVRSTMRSPWRAARGILQHLEQTLHRPQGARRGAHRSRLDTVIHRGRASCPFTLR